MDSQKLDAILREPCSYYGSVCPKMASEAISEHLISKNFLGEHSPRPPQSCMLIHAYIQIRLPHNPPSTNPGYTGLYSTVVSRKSDGRSTLQAFQSALFKCFRINHERAPMYAYINSLPINLQNLQVLDEQYCTTEPPALEARVLMACNTLNSKTPP